MSFTYSAAWTGTRDHVRFLIQDTVAATAYFQDEELDALLLAWAGDARLAAAAALEAWAAALSRSAIRYKVTGFEMDRTETVDAMLKAAARLRDEAKAVPYEYESIVDQAITRYGEDISNYANTSEEEEPFN